MKFLNIAFETLTVQMRICMGLGDLEFRFKKEGVLWLRRK